MPIEHDWLDPDRAYANGAFIAGAERFPPRWEADAAAFRASLGERAKLDIASGPAPRQRVDLFLPPDTPRGLLVFIHGGYWMSFGRESWSHLARGALDRGWACAMPSYTLAPEASIADITREIRQAIRHLATLIAGPVVVTGHSAGGHLAARMACADGPDGVVRVVPISPVAELEPLLATKMRSTLNLDANQCATESPARLRRRDGVDAHVWVGGDERPSFLWQARLLSEAWQCRWTADRGRHHFDVIDGLADSRSPLTEACLGGL
jgi:pimeloyl-ACP methyl ester carboxylesterase